MQPALSPAHANEFQVEDEYSEKKIPSIVCAAGVSSPPSTEPTIRTPRPLLPFPHLVAAASWPLQPARRGTRPGASPFPAPHGRTPPTTTPAHPPARIRRGSPTSWTPRPLLPFPSSPPQGADHHWRPLADTSVCVGGGGGDATAARRLIRLPGRLPPFTPTPTGWPLLGFRPSRFETKGSLGDKRLRWRNTEIPRTRRNYSFAPPVEVLCEFSVRFWVGTPWTARGVRALTSCSMDQNGRLRLISGYSKSALIKGAMLTGQTMVMATTWAYPFVVCFFFWNILLWCVVHTHAAGEVEYWFRDWVVMWWWALCIRRLTRKS
jgi:hypothetical protein